METAPQLPCTLRPNRLKTLGLSVAEHLAALMNSFRGQNSQSFLP